MVSAFVSGSSGPGSSPGRGHCVVFSGKTLYSHSASLHPRCINLMLGGNPAMGFIASPGASRGSIEILLVALELQKPG